MRGRVERFREQLQIDVRAIARAEGTPTRARFLPSAYRDLDELEGFLEHLAREVYDPGLRGAARRDPRRQAAARADQRWRPARLPRPRRRAGARRPRAPTTPTSAGCSSTPSPSPAMALELCALHPRLDRDLLLSAAIVHDLGKTREFTYGAEIERSPEGAMLGHVELGLRLIAAHAPAPRSRPSGGWRSSTA